MERCPACHKKRTEKVRMHFYDYRRCLDCGHVYNCANAQAIRKQFLRLRERYRLVNNEFIQNTLTDEHDKRRKQESKQRAWIVRKFFPEPVRLLEMDCQDGALQKELDSGFAYTGITIDKFYLQHAWRGVRVGDASSLRPNERFGGILVYDYLEYIYDPYADLVKCLSRLKKDGLLVVRLPLNQDPAKKYTAAAHCFSEDSARSMAKYITRNYEVTANFEEVILSLRP